MEKPLPAYKGYEPYVFVCYADDDEDVVDHQPEQGVDHEHRSTENT